MVINVQCLRSFFFYVDKKIYLEHRAIFSLGHFFPPQSEVQLGKFFLICRMGGRDRCWLGLVLVCQISVEREIFLPKIEPPFTNFLLLLFRTPLDWTPPLPLFLFISPPSSSSLYPASERGENSCFVWRGGDLPPPPFFLKNVRDVRGRWGGGWVGEWGRVMSSKGERGEGRKGNPGPITF